MKRQGSKKLEEERRKRKAILITGATGFIGARLTGFWMKRGLPLRVLVRSRLKWNRLFPKETIEVIEGNVEDFSSLKAAVDGVEMAVHAAAVLKVVDRRDFYRVNVEGTKNLALALKRWGNPGARMIYLSSLAAGGPAVGGEPRREEDQDQPVSDYGRSKREGEEAARAVLSPKRLICLRPAIVYGPGDRDFLQFFKMVRQGWVFLPGRGNEKISLIHVDDVVGAIDAVVRTKKGFGGVFYLSDGHSVSWDEAARAAARCLGRPVRVFHLPMGMVKIAAGAAYGVARLFGKPALLNPDKVKEAEAGDWICSNKKFCSCFGWKARIPYSKGFCEELRKRTN